MGDERSEVFCPNCDQQAESETEVCVHCAERLMKLGWLPPAAIGNLSAVLRNLRRDLDAIPTTEDN